MNHLALFLVALPLAPRPVPISQGDDLARRLAALEAELEQARVEAHTVGFAISIVKDDEILFARGFGLADLETKRPVTPETIFAIGSSTKAFTCTVLGMQMDEGLMDWDAPVVEYLPEFELPLDTSFSGDDVVLRMRDLLSHRTGFTRMGVLWGAGRTDRATILRVATRAEPWSPFRKAFFYNNVMYLAAGEAAAVAGERSWSELIQTRIFEPLGMNDSSTSVAEARKDPRLALGYSWNEAKGINERDEMRSLEAIAPAGAINSNVLDMAQWLRFQLGRGTFEGERLISEERIDETWSPQISMGGNAGYGLGWMLHPWKNQRVVQHGGNIDGFSAACAMLPDASLGFVLLTNASTTELQRTSLEMVWSALLGEYVEKAEVPVPAVAAGELPAKEPLSAPELEDFAAFIGTYVGKSGPVQGARFEVLVQSDRLAIDVPGQTTYELRAPDADGKRAFDAAPDAIQILFLRDDSGAVSKMRMFQAGMTFDFERPAERAGDELPTPEELLALRNAFDAGAALDELGVLRLEGTLRFVHSGVEGTTEVTFTTGQDGGRFVQEASFEPFGWTALGWDGNVGWTTSAFDQPDQLDGRYLAQHRLSHPLAHHLDWRRAFDSAEVIAKEEESGRPQWVVRLKKEPLPARTLYVDAETGDITRMESSTLHPGAGGIPTTTRFEDYREVHGTRIPFLVVAENPSSGRSVTQYAELETGVDASETGFSMPSND